MADQNAPKAAKKSTAKKAPAAPKAAEALQAAPVPVATPPAPEAPACGCGEGQGCSSPTCTGTPAPSIAPEVPAGASLEELVAWVADAGTQDAASSRADAVYNTAVTSEAFTEAELIDLGGALTGAVYGTPDDSTTPAAADGPQQVPPTGVVEQDPGAGDATPPPGDGGAPDEANDPAAERAAALARLTGGTDDGELSPGGSEDVPAPLPTLTGVEHEWGGPVRYVVLGYLFNAIVNGRHLTAYQGDVVKMTPEGAARGLEHRNIAVLGEEDPS